MNTPKICSQALSIFTKNMEENPFLSAGLLLAIGAIAMRVFDGFTYGNTKSAEQVERHITVFEQISTQLGELTKKLSELLTELAGVQSDDDEFDDALDDTDAVDGIHQQEQQEIGEEDASKLTSSPRASQGNAGVGMGDSDSEEDL